MKTLRLSLSDLFFFVFLEISRIFVYFYSFIDFSKWLIFTEREHIGTKNTFAAFLYAIPVFSDSKQVECCFQRRHSFIIFQGKYVLNLYASVVCFKLLERIAAVFSSLDSPAPLPFRSIFLPVVSTNHTARHALYYCCIIKTSKVNVFQIVIFTIIISVIIIVMIGVLQTWWEESTEGGESALKPVFDKFRVPHIYDCQNYRLIKLWIAV